MKNIYDVIVVGAGPGGYVLALECGRRGMSVALIDEGERLGGTCLNIGCIPSKALLESSELFFRLKTESFHHGITSSSGGDFSGIKVDIPAVMSRKTDVVNKLTGGISTLMKARSVDVVRGRGTVVSPGELQVQFSGDKSGDTILKSPRIVLATGSRPASLDALPFDGRQVLDSTDALALDKVPKSLAVIGAGAVGLELGSVWSRFGSRVTVIEAMDQIIPGADAQAARTLSAALKKQGLEIKTSAKLEDASQSAKLVTLKISDKKGNLESLKVEKVLVAIGRRAAIDSGLGGNVKPELSADGRFIKVDENFSTSVAGLYAIGDVIGNPMLAHKAEDEGMALAGLFAGEAKAPWSGPIPGIVYTDPELAWAGETEQSLKASGTDYIKGSFPFVANGRALAAGASDGFVKLLSSPGDGKLLGGVIVGRAASELISELVTIMAMGGCAEDIALTVHGHPTLSEAVKEAALATIGKPLHRS